jgi:hypothetical protein
MGTNDAETMIKGLPQKTMFRQLTDMGHDFRGTCHLNFVFLHVQ